MAKTPVRIQKGSHWISKGESTTPKNRKFVWVAEVIASDGRNVKYKQFLCKSSGAPVSKEHYIILSWRRDWFLKHFEPVSLNDFEVKETLWI